MGSLESFTFVDYLWKKPGGKQIVQELESALTPLSKKGAATVCSAAEHLFEEEGLTPNFFIKLAASTGVGSLADIRVPDQKPSVDPDWQAGVNNYLFCLEALESQKNPKSAFYKLGSADPVEHTKMSLRLWALMKNAKLYIFNPKIVVDVYHEADVYTTEVVCGEEWQNRDIPIPSSFNPATYFEKVMTAGAQIGFPTSLPFDVVYLAYGSGTLMAMGDFLARSGMRKAPLSWENADQVNILGHLITSGGCVYEFIRLEFNDGSGVFYLPKRTPEKGWDFPFDLTPWTINTLLDIVSSYSTTVVQPGERSFSYRRHVEKVTSTWNQKIPPPMYYMVNVRDPAVVSESSKKFQDHTGASSREWAGYSHQFDRSGGDWYYVRRGPLPLDPDEEKSLRKRRYEIYVSAPPPEKIQHELDRRKIPKKLSTEWMAVLVTHRRDTLVPKNPPPGMPYVPSGRKIDRRPS